MAIAKRNPAILAALTLAIAGAAVPALSAPASAAPASVPWQKAGPGWAIALYSASSLPLAKPVKRGAITLYLTSPTGQKYPFYRFAASKSEQNLIGWSGDRQRVLVETSTTRNQYVQISLATGKIVSRFTLPSTVFPLLYTRPDGLALLTLRQQGSSTQIVRYDLAGHQQLVLASGKNLDGSAIDSPSGTEVVVGTRTGLELVSNSTGTLIRRLAPSERVTGCYPVRWWSASTILASCSAAGKNFESRLWLFPAGGGTAKALTPQRTGTGFDFGDIAAWKLHSGLFLQALGPAECSISIARQPASGPERQVAVPGYASADIATALGSQLLARVYGSCFTSASLAWFNLTTRSLSYVIHAPANVVGVQLVIPFGSTTSS